ncbi:unnamed protein product [Closterium sp. NIES-54]
MVSNIGGLMTSLTETLIETRRPRYLGARCLRRPSDPMASDIGGLMTATTAVLPTEAGWRESPTAAAAAEGGGCVGAVGVVLLGVECEQC